MSEQSRPTAAQVPDYVHIRDLSPTEEGADSSSCFFDVDGPTTSEAAAGLGHEPNGYFWAGVVRRLVEKGELPDVETDPEGDMLSAYGPRPLMDRLAQALVPYLTDPHALSELIAEADAAGFDFDD